jgi:hypothetical protein
VIRVYSQFKNNAESLNMAMQLSDANQKVLLLAFQATPQSGWLKVR